MPRSGKLFLLFREASGRIQENLEYRARLPFHDTHILTDIQYIYNLFIYFLTVANYVSHYNTSTL